MKSVGAKEPGFIEFVGLMACLTSLVALSIDAMLPALGHIGQAYGVDDHNQLHLVVSLFFLGLAVGQLIYGPVADAKGRRFAILSGMGIFVVGTVLCLLADSLESLLIGRVIQAVGVSGPRVATMALIRDKHEGPAMARIMSFIMMVFILVPMLAPVVGQAVLVWFSWRHIFTMFALFAFLVGGWFYFRQPETLSIDKRKPFRLAVLAESLRIIVSSRQVMGYTLAMGCIFGAFLAYLSGSQTLFQEIYDTGEYFPLCFALLAFGIGFSSFVNGKLVSRIRMTKLCAAAISGWIVCSGILLLLAHYCNGKPPLWALLTMLLLAFFCVGILFGNLNALAMQPLGRMAGLGAAVIGALSNGMAVPISITIGSRVHASVIPLAEGFLIFGVLTALMLRWAAKAKTA